MGQRANLVLIENGKWQLFYDHWIANSLHYELLWGPSIAVDYLRGMKKQEPDSWLDEIWCEGAALVDLDRKHLLWYNLETCYEWSHLQALMPLLRYRWQGWTVEWAWQGLTDFVRYLGLPDHLVITPDREEEALFFDQTITLVSYVQNGQYKVGRVKYSYRFKSQIVRKDPSQLMPILRDWLFGWPENEERPKCGIHFDFDTQTLYYWRNRVFSLATERLAIVWPNWKINYLRDNALQSHLRLLPIDIDLPQPDLVALQRDQVENLARSFKRSISNPIPKIVERLESEGNTVYVNPDTFYSAASVRDAEKQAILQDLEARLPID